MSTDREVDVAIVGGGLVGASLAVALARTSLRVLLIEAASPPASAPAWDERCIALNDASARIFASFGASLGLMDALRADAEPILATHISEQGRFGVTRFDAAEAGVAALGYNVPLRAIGAALTAAMAEAPNLETIALARVVGVEAGEGTVTLAVERADGMTGNIAARLVAAADGAHSAVRELLGIAQRTHDYHQHAIVSAVRLSRPHRGIAYERFTPDGPLALIPKPGDAASLVWTVPAEKAEAVLSLSDAAYIAAAQKVFGGRLGPFTALGARRGYPLSRVMSAGLTAPRAVFIGNAAQSLHPVAAQGFNLGLRDVATLGDLLGAKGIDPGAATLLATYEARRAQDRNRVSDLTDVMVRTFSNRLPGLSQARHWGLVAVDLAPSLRAVVLRQHLGQLGLPQALRDTGVGDRDHSGRRPFEL